MTLLFRAGCFVGGGLNLGCNPPQWLSALHPSDNTSILHCDVSVQLAAGVADDNIPSVCRIEL